MTARAVEARPQPASIRVPAVGSTALQPVMSRAPLHARVLGSSSHAIWLLAHDDVVVVSARDATRLPNGVEIAVRSVDEPFALVTHGAAAVIGPASIDVRGLSVDVVRWWDPRPVLSPVSTERIFAAIEGLPASVPDLDPASLGAALAFGGERAIVSAVRALVGRGPGLTPEADDYLAGALAATRILGVASGSRRVVAALDRAQPQLELEAARRTTSLSAALIRCAIRGQVAAPAGAFLRAIAGRGDIVTTHCSLTRVGHSSGPALAAGMVLGARSLVEGHTTTNGGSP
jgi:hypothetical protein